MPDKTILFLDTNSLLHYPIIREVDWKSVCATPQVRLVLCMEVIHELDEKKNHPTLGARAKRTIKEIEPLVHGNGTVTDGVTLEVFNYEIKSSDFPANLSSDSSDDRIVLSTKKFAQEKPDSFVAVYTEDLGMSLRCKANGIRVIKPDENARLDNPQDETGRKLKDAQLELQQLKNRLPVVELFLCNTGLEKPNKDSQFEVEGKFTLRNINDEVNRYTPSLHIRHRINTKNMGLWFEDTRAADQAAQRDYREDKENKRAELELEYKVQQIEAFCFPFAIWVENSGTTKAEDVHIEIDFGDSPYFVFFKNEQYDAHKGQVIQWPQDTGETITREPQQKQWRNQQYVLTSSEKSNSHKIIIYLEKMIHNGSLHIADLVIILKQDRAKTFPAKCKIRVGNHPELKEKAIPLKIINKSAQA